jgi:hypothetical protein
VIVSIDHVGNGRNRAGNIPGVCYCFVVGDGLRCSAVDINDTKWRLREVLRATGSIAEVLMIAPASTNAVPPLGSERDEYFITCRDGLERIFFLRLQVL